MADNEIKQRVTIDGGEKAAADLNRIAEAEGKVARQVDKGTSASAKASEAAQRRGRSEERLKDKLHQLTLVEARHQQRVKRGERVIESDIQASGRRERMIERLGARLGVYARANDHATTTVRKYSGAADEAASEGAKLESGFASLAGGAKTLAGGLAGVGGLLAVLGQLRKEYEAIVEVQDRAFRSQLTLASARRLLVQTMPGAPLQEVEQQMDVARDIAEKRNVPEAQVVAAMASGISATSGNRKLAAQLVDFASQLSPEQPENIAQVAGAIGDVMGAINTTNPKEALGFLEKVQAIGRVVEPSKAFRVIPPAAQSLIATGFSKDAAGAFFAALSSAMKDAEGDITKSASINFGKQLQAFFRQLGRPERGMAAIHALQRNPELFSKFMENFSVDVQAFTPIRQLISSANSPNAKLLEADLVKMGQPSTWSAMATTTLHNLVSGNVEKTAQLHRTLQTALDQLNNTNITGAQAGAIRADLADVLKAAGETDLAARISSVKFEMGTRLGRQNIAQEFAAIIQERIDALTATSELVTASPFAAAFAGGVMVPMKVPRTPSKRDVETAAILGGIITDLHQFGMLNTTGSNGAAPVVAAVTSAMRGGDAIPSSTPTAAAAQSTVTTALPARKSGVDPFVEQAINDAAETFDNPDLLEMDLGHRPIMVHQTVIHRQINTRKNPYTSDLYRREPVR